MVSFNGTTIHMNRGDGIQLNLTIDTIDNTPYIIKDTDEIHFLLTNQPTISPRSKKILDKTFSLGAYDLTTTQVSVFLTTGDTMYLKNSNYYYLILLVHNDDKERAEESGYEYYGSYPETIAYGKFILDF